MANLSDDPKSRIIVALDKPTLDEARTLARKLRGRVGMLKVGLQLFVRYGREALCVADEAEAPIFLDLKLHDIPATVGHAVTQLIDLNQVELVTVHALGGPVMLRAARDAAGEKLSLAAVTILTSMDATDLSAIGVSDGPSDAVMRLAKLAADAGLPALVCSAAEATRLKQATFATKPCPLTLITPGIRLANDSNDDQKRVMTPADAIKAGADRLVVGRSIHGSPNPAAAADRIADEIAAALAAAPDV